jgi:hypothetical protein
MGPTYGNIVDIINLQVQLWNSPLEKSWQPLLPAPPLIALIGHQQQPWQLMQLDIATLSALETLAIGATLSFFLV